MFCLPIFFIFKNLIFQIIPSNTVKLFFLNLGFQIYLVRFLISMAISILKKRCLNLISDNVNNQVKNYFPNFVNSSMQLIRLIQSIQTTQSIQITYSIQSIQLAQSIQNYKLSRSSNLPLHFPNFCNFSKCSQSSQFGQSGQSGQSSESSQSSQLIQSNMAI